MAGTYCTGTEVIVVNDNSSDETEAAVLRCSQVWPNVRLVRRHPPSGFGRALRSGLPLANGEIIIVYMADMSDHPSDALHYYEKIVEGYDCVFGSRFIAGSKVRNYPAFKLMVNRVVNNAIRLMFWTEMNDLTNAFKAYRREVIENCGPYKSCHFNITLEISLSALIGGYKIAQIPIQWEGRTWGSSNLRLQVMGRRYLCTLLMMFFQRLLINDDLRSERFSQTSSSVELFPQKLNA